MTRKQYAQVFQYAAAVAIVVAALLQDDQVMAALGAWLSPSLVTLIAAVASAVKRKDNTPVNPADETTEPIILE